MANGKVRVAVPGGATKTFKANSATARVLERLKELYGVGDLLDAEGDSVVENDLCAGSYGYTVAQAVIQATPDAPSPWKQQSERVDKLLMHYNNAARAARRIARHDTGSMVFGDDLGLNFKVVGREEAYQAILEGVGSMFHKFLHPAKWLVEHQRMGDSFFAMVAFPGAGKSTLGRRAWEFLHDSWRSWADPEKQSLLKLKGPDYEIFKQMAESSLKVDLCMYHVVAHDEGGVVPAEKGVEPESLLALRCLFSIIDDQKAPQNYNVFLSDFDDTFPGLKKWLQLDDVLLFLRRALGVDDETWLLPNFFFDELNAITKSLDGTTCEPTWFKSAISKFVARSYWMARSEKRSTARTFPVVTLASTRYSSGSLMFTESAKAKAKLIPLRPLTQEESGEVVLDFTNRLAALLDRPPVPKLGMLAEHFLLPIAGGMPRTLGLGLASICSEQKLDMLFDFLTRDDPLKYDDAMRFLEDWTLKAGEYFAKYWKIDSMQVVLLRALAASLLGVKVARDRPILPDYMTSSPENLWGSLEDAGLVSLCGGGSTRDVGRLQVPVRCSPFLVSALVKRLRSALDISWSGVWTRDWREKEKADVQAVLLRAYLLDASYGQKIFRLVDVMPPGSLIPPSLQRLELELIERNYVLDTDPVDHHTVSDVELLCKRRKTSSLLGPGNLGADGFVFCVCRPSGKRVILVFQSKQTVSNVSQVASVLEISFKKDIGKLCTLPKISKEDEAEVRQRQEVGASSSHYNLRSGKNKLVVPQEQDSDEDAELMSDSEAPEYEDDKKSEDSGASEYKDDYVYVFNTNRPITGEFKTKVQGLQNLHPYFCRTVFCFEESAVGHGDALSVLAAVRRLD